MADHNPKLEPTWIGKESRSRLAPRVLHEDAARSYHAAEGGDARQKDYFKELDRIVSMFLDYAENQASRRIPTKMSEWVTRLDAFLKFNDYELSPDQLPG